MNEVGVRYQKGLGVTADATAAVGWFTVATQHGLPARL
jgi:TPR repeat protein